MMKRFQFSLETLLTLRREEEQEREIALASAVSSLISIDMKIEKARQAGEKAFSTESLSIEGLRARDLLWLKSVDDRKALEEPRREAAKRVDEARILYTEAHSRKAALEKLREKRKEQWKIQSKREEIMRLDETAKGAEVRRRLTGGGAE